MAASPPRSPLGGRRSPDRLASSARGARTRERVLAAAEPLLARRGFEATSMQDVAARAGLGVGTLYHHFPDKKALLLALLDRFLERMEAERRGDGALRALLDEEHPRRAVSRWLRGAYDRLRKRPNLYLTLLAQSDSDPEIRERRQRIDRLAVERLAAGLEAGRSRARLRTERAPRAAAFLLHHAVETVAVQLLVRDVADPPPDEVLEELATMICLYLLPERV